MVSKKSLIITIISVLCLISLAQAEEKENAKIELIPVYEKTFDDTIVDVIFDTATVTIEEAKRMGWKEEAFIGMKTNERVKVIYHKIVMVKKKGKAHYVGVDRSYGSDVTELKFYNKKGVLLKIMDAGTFEHSEELEISPRGRYFCIAKYPKEVDLDYRGGIIYNSDGKKIWEIENYTPIAISDEGYAIATYVDWEVPPEPGGTFYVYDNKGKMKKTIENPDSSHLIARFAKFSDDGEWAIVVFKRETYPPTHITLIKKTGEVIWERYFPECAVTAMKAEFAIIPYVGVCGIWDNQLEKGTGAYRNTEVYFIDWQGNLKWVAPLGIRGWMIVNISEDRGRVYVASTEGYLWCFNIRDGKPVWRHKESWAPELQTTVLHRQLLGAPTFREMGIIDMIYIVGGEWTNWRNSTFSVFDASNGNLLTRMEFMNEKVGIAFFKQYVSLIKKSKGQVFIFKQEDLR